MNRHIFKIIIKMIGEAILLAIIVGIVILGIGHIKNWETTLLYCNAFFIAGCFLIVAGTSTRYTAGQNWRVFQFLHAESFRQMSSGDRANFIIDASSSGHLVILGLLSGGLLILISVFLM